MSRSNSVKRWEPLRWTGADGLGIHTLVWLAVWSSITTGPWNILNPQEGLEGWLNGIRASMPLVVLAVWVVLLPFRLGRGATAVGPLVLWILYALVMLVSSFQHDHWFSYAYWPLAYLSVFAAIDFTLSTSSVNRAANMVRLNWLLATLFLVAMLFLARDVLFVEGKTGLTAYDLNVRAGVISGVVIPRTSGLARLSIVPAVVGFVFMLQSAGAKRVVWGAVFLGAAIMIWFFQARQGIFGMAFALGFVMLILGGSTRAFGVVTMFVGGLLLFAGALPEDLVSYVAEHATRGEGTRAFESMTGRDVLWRLGWRAVEDSPWIGFGPEADRRLLHQNASNGFLYAGMCAGYPGAALYAGGLIWGWWLFAKAYLNRRAWSAEEQAFLWQVGGIMMYLTLRNIAENTAAFYSIDLYLHATMIAYLGVVVRDLRRRTVSSGTGERRVATPREMVGAES